MIDLVWIGGTDAPAWDLGDTYVVPVPTPASLDDCITGRLDASTAAAWLFWDPSLGSPDPKRIHRALSQPGDAWHAGLRLGLAGAPGIIDFVHPTWMLNRDPDPRKRATSWRLSFRACLIRTEVLRQMGGPHPGFRSLDAAGLELGHRYIQRGVFVRHEPELVARDAARRTPNLSIEDEVRFTFLRFGRAWMYWAVARALATGYASPRALLRALRKVNTASPPRTEPFRRTLPRITHRRDPRVTVLIPTLERYPYLRRVLDQLRAQTIPPFEVVVVDQTPRDQRDCTIQEWVPDLPIRAIYLDSQGQCTSRNLGLGEARGDFVLFLDDDDEIGPDLIERHLATFEGLEIDVCSGVAVEAGSGPLPGSFAFMRASDVFPTNNTLIRRTVLEESGLFDLAYDRGQRADGDLGTRIYLSGAMMVLDPDASVFHHHAPRGGLRAHKARVITAASSRSSIRQRHLPSISELYLWQRYHSPRQVREMIWIRVLATFSLRGSGERRILKLLWGALSLPDTLLTIRERRAAASRMLERFPQIPRVGSRRGIIPDAPSRQVGAQS